MFYLNIQGIFSRPPGMNTTSGIHRSLPRRNNYLLKITQTIAYQHRCKADKKIEKKDEQKKQNNGAFWDIKPF